MSKLKATTRKQKSKRPARNRDEAAFQIEWQRVQRLQTRNDKLSEEIETFYAEFLREIEPSESKVMDCTFALCSTLIGHLSKKTLPDYLRLALMDWTEALLDELHERPLYDKFPLHDLVQKYNEQMVEVQNIEQQKFQKKLAKQGFSQEEIDDFSAMISGEDSEQEFFSDEDSSIFDDIFSEFADDTEDDEDEIEEDLFGEYFAERARQQQAKEHELDKLLKATPINVLFRKIARVLHPDLEQDPTAKAEKHHLMSHLIKARDDKDIPAILGFYQQYVGALPEGFFEGNFDKLTQLLKHQAQKLIQMRNQIIESAGLRGFLFERYKGSSAAATRRQIQIYINENQALTRQRNRELSKCNTLKTLRPLLEDRLQRYWD